MLQSYFKMKTDIEGKFLRIFIGESDNYQGEPLYEVIVRKAKEQGLSGATVLRGVEGFGANSVIHTARLLDLSGDMPIVVELVDMEEKIQLLLPIINQLIEETNCGAFFTLEKTHIIKYSPSKK